MATDPENKQNQSALIWRVELCEIWIAVAALYERRRARGENAMPDPDMF
jgi:hypothetical protein